VTTRPTILISLAIAALILLILWIRYGEFWKIDACLDSGRAWDYSVKECRH
jgi:hypothetical protein